MKKYQYLASWDDQTLTRVGEPVVVLGDSNVSQVEVTLPSDFLLDPTKAECRMYFLLPGEKESGFETLEIATKDENGDSHVTWTIKHVHSQKGGRLAFSLTLIGDDAQWDSRTAIIPVYESRYQPESEEAEKPYTGRLDALEGSMASIRGEFAEVQDDFEDLKETATLGTPIPESLVANMQEGRVYIYTGTETGYTAGHVYYYVGGALTDGGVYGGTAVDATLTQSGKAADAKVTGDKIAEIKEDLSALNAGDYAYITDYIEGYYIDNSGATVNVNKPVKNANQKYCIIPASEGDEFYISLNSGGAARAYSFIDANSNVLEVAEAGAKFTNAKITAPSGSVTLIVNRDKREDAYVAKASKLIDWLKELQSDVSIVQRNPIFKTQSTYNLVDYIDMLYNTKYGYDATKQTESYISNTGCHTIRDLIPVEPGQIVTSSKHIISIWFFDANKTYIGVISSESQDQAYETFIVPDSAHYMKPMWRSYQDIGENGVETGELAYIYVVPQYGAKSVRYALKPKTQINGRYVSDDIFEVANPAENSNLDIIYKCREIKRQNRERGVVRIATFNIYGAMIAYGNWPTVKKECAQYGIDVCGFQEVRDSVKSKSGVNEYSFSRDMMGEAFKFSHLGDSDPDGAGIRILSGLNIVSGEYTTYEYTYKISNQTFTATGGYSHAIIDLPNYHHARAWDKKMSIYTCHFSTVKAQSLGMLEHLATVIAADTSEYKTFVADTNCFSLDAETGKPWIWKYFTDMGLYPAATDFTKSSYCYPISQEEWDNGVLDFIDNVFATSNMKCLNWGIVDSQNYPLNVSGGYVSDHCMLYADMIFDYVDGFSDT